MIVLDTNVISEPLRPRSEPAVLAWLDDQDSETLFMTAISLAELRHCVAALPKGKRRKELAEALEEKILPLFAGRILPFDEAAAASYAEIRVRARATGKAIGTADSYIAATVAAHGFAIATRDTTPFEAVGLKIVNPWR